MNRVDSLEFDRQVGARIGTGYVGLAEEVGESLIGLGIGRRPLGQAVHHGLEPFSHQLHAIGAVSLVCRQLGDLLPESESDSPEREYDQSDRTEDLEPQRNSIAARCWRLRQVVRVFQTAGMGSRRERRLGEVANIAQIRRKRPRGARRPLRVAQGSH